MEVIRDRELHEECGVFGIYGVPNAASLTYYGLHALQHRGQEGAGIVSVDESGTFRRLKGLMDGLKLDTETNEGKMIAAIVDLLGDMTKKVVDIEDTTIAISDELDEIEEDLDAIEDYILDEEDDEDDDYVDEDGWDDDEDDEEDDGEEGFDFGDEETTVYEVQCACGNIIDFDEDVLESGSIVCDKCGETLEFSFDDDEEDDK